MGTSLGLACSDDAVAVDGPPATLDKAGIRHEGPGHLIPKIAELMKLNCDGAACCRNEKSARVAGGKLSALSRPTVLVFQCDQVGHLQPAPRETYGYFRIDGTYVVLETRRTAFGRLRHHIYIWVGHRVVGGTSMNITAGSPVPVELEEHLESEPTISRERMGHETARFRGLFGCILYVDGDRFYDFWQWRRTGPVATPRQEEEPFADRAVDACRSVGLKSVRFQHSAEVCSTAGADDAVSGGAAEVPLPDRHSLGLAAASWIKDDSQALQRRQNRASSPPPDLAPPGFTNGAALLAPKHHPRHSRAPMARAPPASCGPQKRSLVSRPTPPTASAHSIADEAPDPRSVPPTSLSRLVSIDHLECGHRSDSLVGQHAPRHVEESHGRAAAASSSGPRTAFFLPHGLTRGAGRFVRSSGWMGTSVRRLGLKASTSAACRGTHVDPRNPQSAADDASMLSMTNSTESVSVNAESVPGPEWPPGLPTFLMRTYQEYSSGTSDIPKNPAIMGSTTTHGARTLHRRSKVTIPISEAMRSVRKKQQKQCRPVLGCCWFS